MLARLSEIMARHHCTGSASVRPRLRFIRSAPGAVVCSLSRFAVSALSMSLQIIQIGTSRVRRSTALSVSRRYSTVSVSSVTELFLYAVDAEVLNISSFAELCGARLSMKQVNIFFG